MSVEATPIVTTMHLRKDATMKCYRTRTQVNDLSRRMNNNTIKIWEVHRRSWRKPRIVRMLRTTAKMPAVSGALKILVNRNHRLPPNAAKAIEISIMVIRITSPEAEDPVTHRRVARGPTTWVTRMTMVLSSRKKLSRTSPTKKHGHKMTMAVRRPVSQTSPQPGRPHQILTMALTFWVFLKSRVAHQGSRSRSS